MKLPSHRSALLLSEDLFYIDKSEAVFFFRGVQYNDQFRPFRHNCSSLSGFEVPRRRGQPICGLAGPRGARAVRSSAPAGVWGVRVSQSVRVRACKVIASVTHVEVNRVESVGWLGRVTKTWPSKGRQWWCKHREDV